MCVCVYTRLEISQGSRESPPAATHRVPPLLDAMEGWEEAAVDLQVFVVRFRPLGAGLGWTGLWSHWTMARFGAKLLVRAGAGGVLA